MHDNVYGYISYLAISKKYFRKHSTVFESFETLTLQKFPAIRYIATLQVYIYTYSCRVETGSDHIQGRCFTFSLGHEKSESTLSNITVTIIL